VRWNGACPIRPAEGGRPPYDAVLMFKILVVQMLYTLSDDHTEYQIHDRCRHALFGAGAARCSPRRQDDMTVSRS
jgi:transposase, IS5 family